MGETGNVEAIKLAAEASFTAGYTGSMRVAKSPTGELVLQLEVRRYDTGATRWENTPIVELTAEQMAAGGTDWE
jgi:hypothetical protein